MSEPIATQLALDDADIVLGIADRRAADEGHVRWSARHYELMREEWLRAYPEADERTRQNLDQAVACAGEAR